MPVNPADPSPTPAPPNPDSRAESSAPARARRPRRLLRSIVMTLLAILILGAIGLGGAEYYTARPDFCGTCHVMDPYYESWSHDLHGTKLDVWCVDCHYAPGEQHTLKAKFKGLSQVASYFSGRYGAARPRARVDDASCLRSACHGDAAHRDKMLLIGEPRMEKRLVAGFETQVQRSPTVRFVHSKHLDAAARIAETEAAQRDLAGRLRATLSPQDFAALEAACRSVQPAPQRTAAVTALMQRLDRAPLLDEALELMRLEHMRLRLVQLDGINCAACHTYDPQGKGHFAVDQQTCFTCHFNNQEFNRHTGECLKCHEPPTRRIAVHSAPPQTAGRTIPAAGSALMDHLDIVNRGIDCASCHFDVVRGDAQVSARDCTHCHDQQKYLLDFAGRDTKTVEEYHRVHVADQRARCADCHRSVEHRLIEPQLVGSSADFLQPVIQDCQHCHPAHHSEQVHLLMGVGGRGVELPMPNAMFGSRINCRACHTQTGSDFKGDPLIEATQSTCVACHGDDYRQLFEQWVGEMDSTLSEAEATLARVDARLRELRHDARPLAPDLLERVEQARTNIHFIRSGNGIHNKNYALQLLDLSLRDLDAAMSDLSPQ